MAQRTTATAKRPRTATRKSTTHRPRQQRPPKPSEAEKQELARAKELDDLYRPLREAVEAELEKTKSGRKLLNERQALGQEVGKLSEGVTSGETPREEGDLRMRERLEEFRSHYGDQLVDTQARLAHLQPSAAAVAQILRPEMARQTMWVSEASPAGSMLLQPKTVPIDPAAVVEGPKATPADAGVVTEGLGAPTPPLVDSCVTAPYDRKDDHMTWALFYGELPFAADAHPDRGTTEIGGNCWSLPVFAIDGFFSSAFVGHDFPVPPGPTKYETTISYDWWCWGNAVVAFGLAVVNCNLAIVIDKLDGTRETHAREISLFSVPVFLGDLFNHRSDNARVSIPFERDGLNGTVRIMVGADGHCTTVAFPCAVAQFYAIANVREICLRSVG
jgi:hypothetical protein